MSSRDRDTKSLQDKLKVFFKKGASGKHGELGRAGRGSRARRRGGDAAARRLTRVLCCSAVAGRTGAGGVGGAGEGAARGRAGAPPARDTRPGRARADHTGAAGTLHTRDKPLLRCTAIWQFFTYFSIYFRAVAAVLASLRLQLCLRRLLLLILQKCTLQVGKNLMYPSNFTVNLSFPSN